MSLETILVILVVILGFEHGRARWVDRRWRKAGRGWKLPRRVRPVRRFKATIRMRQWGEFVNSREGFTKIIHKPSGTISYFGPSANAPPQPEDPDYFELYREPVEVLYRDFASYIRLWPNPGYQIRTGLEVRHRCRNRKCPTPRRRPA